MSLVVNEIKQTLVGFISGAISGLGFITVSLADEMNAWAKFCLTIISIAAGVYACIYYHKKIKKL